MALWQSFQALPQVRPSLAARLARAAPGAATALRVAFRAAVFTPAPPGAPPPPPAPPAVVLPPSPPPPLGGLVAGVDFGQDILCGLTPSGAVDLDPNFSMVSGLNCLAQSLCNRFQTAHGSLAYDTDFGRDLRRLVNAGLTPAQIAAEQSGCEAEAEKDPRVNQATAKLVFSGTAFQGNFQLSLQVLTDAGPFELVLSVTKVSVTILAVNTQPSA